ncbi:FxDxF family PEP-CTERM protein [Sphingomonas sp. R1]|uniref:FxDxF family PEP-CTERM protein n=1 Tax=Sphingomonas sp. R1 TaxID=399176 RepID=UPI002224351B|nr:FxDxF family PEP-CTERM protein [Sphingomonas sp. R1]UYY78701.1 FxDxF family PEP-CTERM protein [Sphingomonas sp. R1]
MYRTIMAAALGAAALVAVAPAQAQTYFGPADMNIAFGVDGTISTSFGQSGITAGNFTHIYQFTLPQSGTASGTITTSAVKFKGPTDLDLTSVFFNGVQLTGAFGGGINEVVFANDVPILAGIQNNITINGVSRGNGSYGGQGVFAPTGVPEPAAWGMMIGGFGLAGAAMRRTRRTRVTYANA